MSFRYDVLNMDALVAEPVALKELDGKLRETLDKSNALKGALLDWLAEGKFNKIIVRGVEFNLVKP